MTGFIETEEQQALRKAVSAMAANYGQDYYLEKARAGQHTDELWSEAGKLGFIGVNLPEEYGGGGAGMYELALVMEEMSGAGCPLLMMVAPPRSTAPSSPSSHRGPEEAVVAGNRGRLDHDGVRHHRTRRGLQQPPHHHHRPPRRQRLDPVGPEGVHL